LTKRNTFAHYAVFKVRAGVPALLASAHHNGGSSETF
jgi:hypothetical protein